MSALDRHDWNRRTFLGLSASVLATASAVAGRRPTDAHSDAEIFAAYVRMRGSHARVPVFERTVGWTYGVEDGKPPRLLWQIDGVTVTRYRRLADDLFAARSRYLGVMRDASTGERLLRFSDAESGVTVDVPISQHPPSNMEITPSGSRYGVDPAPRPRLRPTFLGSSVSFTDHMLAPLSLQASPKLDVATLTADCDAAFDPRRPSVDAVMSFTGIERWRPWMRQGDRPGGLLWHAFGRKVARSDVPPEFFDLALEIWREPLEAE